MFTRISEPVLAVVVCAMVAAGALAGCEARERDPGAAAKVGQRKFGGRGGNVECATGDAATFSRSCSLDQTETARGLVLTVHHGDGGFRRLLVTKDGRGVVPADGAAGAHVSIIGTNEIEVAIDGDRYRLPAVVGTR